MNASDFLPANAVLSAIVRKLGAIKTVTKVGSSGTTSIVETQEGTVVVKRMVYARPPEQYLELFRQLNAIPAAPCPELRFAVELEDCWYAVFTYVEGSIPDPTEPLWDTAWQDAFDLLERIRGLTDVVRAPTWELEPLWLKRLSHFDFQYPPARRLLNHLQQAQLYGPQTLAHGDFNAQNFICRPGGLVLVDWEEVGSAHVGFDAGWVLALNTVGSGPRQPQAQVLRNLLARGFPEGNLQWFKELGLLRLLYRAMTLPIHNNIRLFIAERIKAAILLCVEQM